jgi:hypothetical protein
MKILHLTAIALILSLLSACGSLTTASSSSPTTTVIERAKDMQAVLAFNDCAVEGQMRDAAAAKETDQALYLSSADILAGCDAKLTGSYALVEREQRMRVMALASQNYLKGGDVGAARLVLSNFLHAFDHADLIYADGSSFSDTMHALLYQHADQKQLALSSLNARRSVKEEIRRSWYWQKN